MKSSCTLLRYMLFLTLYKNWSQSNAKLSTLNISLLNTVDPVQQNLDHFHGSSCLFDNTVFSLVLQVPGTTQFSCCNFVLGPSGFVHFYLSILSPQFLCMPWSHFLSESIVELSSFLPFSIVSVLQSSSTFTDFSVLSLSQISFWVLQSVWLGLCSSSFKVRAFAHSSSFHSILVITFWGVPRSRSSKGYHLFLFSTSPVQLYQYDCFHYSPQPRDHHPSFVFWRRHFDTWNI